MKKMTEQDKSKLAMWQDRLRVNEGAWNVFQEKFDERDRIYRGQHELRNTVSTPRNSPKETNHCYNIVSENIESEVDSTIPMPKVTPRRKADEWRARIIEDMLRNEIDRIPMEEINDAMERIVPVQGGAFYLLEWDNREIHGDRIGENVVTAIHPKEFVPQDGVFTGIEDMDYFFLKLPQTKQYIRDKYGVDVEYAQETEPEIKATDASTAEDMVTQYVAYYRNDRGGIGVYSWVCDTVLEDIEDYQARRRRHCKRCGAAEGTGSRIMQDGSQPEKKEENGVCPYCGGTEWTDEDEAYEDVFEPRQMGGEEGPVVGGANLAADENGNIVMRATERVPYYKPDVYPLVLQRNISVFGQLLGESDVDKIADQQNTLNRLEQKIINRICEAGSITILPPDTSVTIDENEHRVYRCENVANANAIRNVAFTGDLQYELAYLAQVYEEARRTLGITDSFQGRNDTTATSGKAKEFAASQSAGRLESKRMLKRAAFARLYELIFKFKLAYADEPRPVISKDDTGENKYDYFDRHDFLEQTADGGWRYVDDFIFSTDDASALAVNRQNMWQELTSQLQAGAFGDPTNLNTLILYWTSMEQEHYPGASEKKQYIKEQLAAQQEAMQQQVM
nr:MAG TPA: Portal protein [Caudoviricetes sp.]